MKINATRMTTPIEEKFDQKLKVRTGMVTVSDGKSKPIPVQLHLSMEVLRLQKEEIVPPEPKPINGKVKCRYPKYYVRGNKILNILWFLRRGWYKLGGRRLGDSD